MSKMSSVKGHLKDGFVEVLPTVSQKHNFIFTICFIKVGYLPYIPLVIVCYSYPIMSFIFSLLIWIFIDRFSMICDIYIVVNVANAVFSFRILNDICPACIGRSSKTWLQSTLYLFLFLWRSAFDCPFQWYYCLVYIHYLLPSWLGLICGHKHVQCAMMEFRHILVEVWCILNDTFSWFYCHVRCCFCCSSNSITRTFAMAILKLVPVCCHTKQINVVWDHIECCVVPMLRARAIGPVVEFF